MEIGNRPARDGILVAPENGMPKAHAMMRRFVFALSACLSVACSRKPEEPPKSAPSAATSAAPITVTSTASAATAELGKPAPDFTLSDLDGKAVHLADLRGKVVVLEWFNPGCPFVNNAHTKGSLKTFADAKAKEGVVWLAINSGAQGKQGNGVQANTEGKQKFGLTHPILLDESGQVGRAYGAERTPHLFVIDDKGTLVYRGAIDNSPDGEGESPTDGKLVNYVEKALVDMKAGRPVETPITKAYGCSVKYGS
jgi:peroxiredoxin